MNSNDNEAECCNRVINDGSILQKEVMDSPSLGVSRSKLRIFLENICHLDANYLFCPILR